MDAELPTMDNEPAKKMFRAMDDWLAGEDQIVVINSLESEEIDQYWQFPWSNGVRCRVEWVIVADCRCSHFHRD